MLRKRQAGAFCRNHDVFAHCPNVVPCSGKSAFVQRSGRFAHHSAGAKLPVVCDPKRRSSRTTAYTLRRNIAALRFGRRNIRVECNSFRTFFNNRRVKRSQLVRPPCGSGFLRRDLSRFRIRRFYREKFLEFSSARMGGNIYVPPQRQDLCSFAKAFNSVKISNIVRCYRIVYLDGNTRLP